MTTTRSGRCLCGSVSFVARDVPDEFGACYCDMCRRWGGSALIGVFVGRATMAVTGQENIAVYKSSDWAERAFCKTCGSGLWYHVTEGDHAAHVSVPIGLFDDTRGLTLVREYFIDKRPAALDFPAGRTQLTEAETIALFAPSSEEG